MLIRNTPMDVDVREELADYMHMFRRSTDKGSHLNSCSPFRSDSHPSFYVYFEDTESARAGYWGDHAADDAEFSRGTFLKLLAFLRDESEDTTFEYLNGKYGTDAEADISRLKLKPSQRMMAWVRTRTVSRTPETFMDEYAQTHLNAPGRSYDYLAGRGISNETAAKNHIGYLDGALAIPWKDGGGNLITVKYRALDSKKFWYMSGGMDITNQLYGLNVVYASPVKRLYIVESEIDVLYLQSLGYDAVALGNKAMNEGRAELLRKAPFDELCIIPDNDEPGRYAAETIVKFMEAYKDVYLAEIPSILKDINDCTPSQVHEILDEAMQIKPLSSKIVFNA